MTDAQLLLGIMQNDEQAWRYIYHNMRMGFASILMQEFATYRLQKQDIEDIFQEAMLVHINKI